MNKHFSFFCEGNSGVECQLPKLNVAGSSPVPRFFSCPKTFFVLIACILMAGCAAPAPKKPAEQIPLAPAQKGIYHKVKTGETLWRIAKAYNVSIAEIVNANKIPDVAKIEKDQLVFIPGASAEQQAEAASGITPRAASFIWPIKGKVISYYGDRKDAWINRGVDIETAPGEKISAARDGKVVFADFLNGYKHTVILDHGDNFFTVYAQNDKLLVKLGDRVLQGDTIAECGKSGELAFLHFEIRKNSAADNPLYYLP